MPAVYGALLGVQEGRSIEICNSFELLVNTVDGRVEHDAEYFSAKEKQCKLQAFVIVWLEGGILCVWGEVHLQTCSG
jgi:COP9 signalosome complex subunit 6